jgi:predicted trehalose synthase
MKVRLSVAIPYLSDIAQAIIKLGDRMSELTDSVDAALAAFLANEADEDAALTLANATIETLQAQIDELTAGGAANVAELEKVRDALLAQLPQEPSDG